MAEGFELKILPFAVFASLARDNPKFNRGFAA
jgi:hypothetical protein